MNLKLNLIFQFQIDSIKWYKDGREFFRLHPNMPINNDNHKKQFQTAGVKIDYNTTSVRMNLTRKLYFIKTYSVWKLDAERTTHCFTGEHKAFNERCLPLPNNRGSSTFSYGATRQESDNYK